MISLTGAVLCFLPGWQDIKAVQKRLEEKPTFRSGSQIILPCKDWIRGLSLVSVLLPVHNMLPVLFLVRSQCDIVRKEF